MSARAQVDDYQVVVLDAQTLVDVGAIPQDQKLMFTVRGAVSAYLALGEALASIEALPERF